MSCIICHILVWVQVDLRSYDRILITQMCFSHSGLFIHFVIRVIGVTVTTGVNTAGS